MFLAAAVYNYHNGLFGDRGQGGSSMIRNIVSDDPQATAKDFFDRLTYGGIEKTLYYKDGTEKGKRVTMADESKNSNSISHKQGRLF